MLKGRESLSFLVGKRRRFLPNRKSLLSSPVQGSLNLCTDEDGKIVSTKSPEGSGMAVFGDEKSKVESFGGREEGSDMSEEVICPVCGNKVRGNNYVINSHIDLCLSRGTKRKMTQRTLLQMKFCSPSKVQVCLDEKDQSGNNLLPINHDERIVRNGVHVFPNFDGCEENDSTSSLSESVLNSKSVKNKDGSSKSSICDDKTDDNIDMHSLSQKNEMPDDDTAITLDDISGVTLETFIVGRKFSDEKEINFGERIYLVRDPHNVKDPNAVKIMSANHSEPRVLGFLPRELAQCLSPLIEKYCLSFEGKVASVPKDLLDVVPVQISCQKAVSDENKENDNVELFRYLWRNALQVTESTKNGQTSMTKYQQNFSILIREVLRSNIHLLIDGEQQFLESFDSFSDDSQRLFVRLYTRKGPWFRMSNIFYPEILDPQKAMKELSAMGYLRSCEDTNELHYDDMNDILNLLTISELKEIMSILKQPTITKFNFGENRCLSQNIFQS